jgi:hypothetical protein
MTHGREAPRLRLTERDIQILQALGSYRFLSVPQLQALFFPSASSSERRMRELTEAGYVTRVFMPARPYDRQVHTIFALSPFGGRFLKDADGELDLQTVSESDKRTALFLDHTLRRNDVRVCLELLAREDPRIQLLTWKQRVEDVKTVVRICTGRSVERVPLIPDGVFVLLVEGHTHGFAVEVDMGSVQLTRMERRYRGYWRWQKDHGPERRFGVDSFRVLTLTTTDRRLEALRKAAMKAPERRGSDSGLFWFARLVTADIEEPLTLLSPVWTTAVRRTGETPRPLLS